MDQAAAGHLEFVDLGARLILGRDAGITNEAAAGGTRDCARIRSFLTGLFWGVYTHKECARKRTYECVW